MQLSTSAAIRQKYPEAQITISSPFPDQDRPFYSGAANVVPCHRRRLIFAGFQLVRAVIWRLLKSTTGYSANWIIPDQELKATREADLVIDLSGDMLTDDYGPHVAWSHYIPILFALILDRPVFICAQSIGPFRWTGWIAKQLFTRAAAITVRDSLSFEHLRAVGISEEQLQLTADMAFLLEPATPARIQEILATENITLSNRSLIGVSVSRILEGLYNQSEIDGTKFSEIMANVLDDFAECHDVDILFIPHVTGPTKAKDDRNIGAEVAKRMTSSPYLVQGDYRPDELKALIKCSDLFLGARMHANIAALSTGVPVIALSYSHKTPGIMALFGQSDWVVAGDEITETKLRALLEEAWQRRHVSADLIHKAGQRIRIEASKNIDLVESLSHK